MSQTLGNVRSIGRDCNVCGCGRFVFIAQRSNGQDVAGCERCWMGVLQTLPLSPEAFYHDAYYGAGPAALTRRADALAAPGPADELAARIATLEASVETCTRWAQASAAEVMERDRTIRALQRAVDEQSAWARTAAADVVQRDATIRELRESLEQMVRWARSSVADVEERDRIIRALQDELRRARGVGGPDPAAVHGAPSG